MRRVVSVRSADGGFTLIELLVSLVIMGVLLAILLPAVQCARETARRLQCGHQLKQIALAMHNYHGTHNSLPYGVNAGWGHSWSAHLLPFVEQQALADIVPWTESGWWGGNDRNSIAFRTLARAKLTLFRCPSQGPPFTSDVNGLPGRFVTNYLACAGGDARHDNRGAGGMDRSNGMFLAAHFDSDPKRPTRLSDVRDGTSRTLMVSESVFLLESESTCFICDRFYLYHPDADSRGGYDFSEALGSTFYPINTSAVNNAERECAFSSHHPGGVCGVHADGATEFFNESVDLETWRAIGSIRDHDLAPTRGRLPSAFSVCHTGSDMAARRQTRRMR
ncbi:MAG: DUF1559 domain-containing protein [Planctomycetes bacterium]|nr:DUF1559 domain-containing protein [Planctomycetota bacterium]